MKRLFITGNKFTKKVKIIYGKEKKAFSTFAAKYVNLIAKKSVDANYFREA